MIHITNYLSLTSKDSKEVFAGTQIVEEDVYASINLLNVGFRNLGQAVFDRSQEARPPKTPITGMDDTNGYVPVDTGQLRASGTFRYIRLGQLKSLMLIRYSAPYALKVEFGTDDPDNQVTSDYSDEIDPNTFYPHSTAKSGYYSKPGMKAIQGSDGNWYTKRWYDLRGFSGRAYYRRARIYVFNRAFTRRMGFQKYIDS